MRILVTGAYGFIGAAIAARLAESGHAIRAAGRDVRDGRRRFPAWDWVEGDFAGEPDWAAHLKGVDAVINCVGVLQDGGGDSTQAAHVDGARRLFAACERVGVRRVIHLSAIGAEAEAGSAYARTKHAGEALLTACDLDWTILRPSLVIARNVYGGTALMRGLAGVPFVTPVIETRARFRPIHIDDLSAIVIALLEPSAPVRTIIDCAGPEAASLEGFVAAQRAWLGFGPAPVWRAPRWLAGLAFAIGDGLGKIGVRTPLRSTARAQMDYNVEGDPHEVPRQLGVHPRPYSAALAAEPAGVQDRWHARLYFAKPIAECLLAAFWIVTGIVCLTVGRDEAIALAQQARLGALAPWAADIGGAFDIAVGAAYIISPRKKMVLALMAAVTLFYAAALGFLLPHLLADPLGRLAKLIPFLALLGLLAATDDRR